MIDMIPNVEHTRKTVAQWEITLWDEPMDFNVLAGVITDAKVYAAIPEATATFKFVDPDQLIIRVEYPDN